VNIWHGSDNLRWNQGNYGKDTSLTEVPEQAMELVRDLMTNRAKIAVAREMADISLKLEKSAGEDYQPAEIAARCAGVIGVALQFFDQVMEACSVEVEMGADLVNAVEQEVQARKAAGAAGDHVVDLSKVPVVGRVN
jgi:hypothetical protein